jgi:riboflavin-specific deaminase-like protein
MNDSHPPPESRPWIVANMAISSDGKIATAGREVTSFGSPADLRGLYRLRATADAVMCGARTVEETGATLGNGGDAFRRIRIRAGLAAAPVRIVVSGSASLDPEAAIWKVRTSPLVVLVSSHAPAPRRRRLALLADALWESPGAQVDLAKACEWIHSRWRVRRMVCEGGGTLNAAMLSAGLLDELTLTLCPRVFGGQASPTIADGSSRMLQDACHLGRPTIRRRGDELFMTYRRAVA